MEDIDMRGLWLMSVSLSSRKETNRKVRRPEKLEKRNLVHNLLQKLVSSQNQQPPLVCVVHIMSHHLAVAAYAYMSHLGLTVWLGPTFR